MIKTVAEELVRTFCSTCQEAARRGLMRCSSGNMSMRLDAERMLVTATGSWLGRLTPDDVVLCNIADGSRVEGRAPTVEIAFHAGILRTRTDMNVVLHFQTPFATTLACRDLGSVNFLVLPEVAVHLGNIGLIPYLTPGSLELAEAVIAVMRNHDMGIMANHGQVTVSRSLDLALQNAEFFELACEIIVRNGSGLRALPTEAVAAFLDARRVGKGVA
jgi:ribulose-5-phosphate 4-epimerase/fuculose-1-phosphate aldolase